MHFVLMKVSSYKNYSYFEKKNYEKTKNTGTVQFSVLVTLTVSF